MLTAKSLAERAVPRGRHAERPQKWREVAVFSRISSICAPVEAAWGGATSTSGTRRLQSSPSSRISAPSAGGQVTPETSRHPRSTDSLQSPSLRIQDQSGRGSPPKPRYRLMSQQPNGLPVLRILRERKIPRPRGPVTARVARLRYGECNRVDQSHRKRRVSPGLQKGDEGVRSQAA
jgi:hypothetical protein